MMKLIKVIVRLRRECGAGLNTQSKRGNQMRITNVRVRVAPMATVKGC
jgi:hypothetical protein